jgi:hypothetical protein
VKINVKRYWLISVVLIIFLLSGCGQRNEVVGTWEFIELRTTDSNLDQEFVDALENTYLKNKYTIEFTQEGEYKASIGSSGGSYDKNGDTLSISVAVLGKGIYKVVGQRIQVYSPNGEKHEYFLKGNTLQCNFDEGIVEVFERK